MVGTSTSSERCEMASASSTQAMSMPSMDLIWSGFWPSPANSTSEPLRARISVSVEAKERVRPSAAMRSSSRRLALSRMDFCTSRAARMRSGLCAASSTRAVAIAWLLPEPRPP